MLEEDLAIAIAKLIRAEGFRVLFVDTNETNVRRINSQGIESFHGNILADGVQEAIDFEGIGKLLAFTPNDEANSLAAVEFRNIFGCGNVFQLSSSFAETSKVAGRIFASQDLSWEKMNDLWLQGYRPFSRDVSPGGKVPSAESEVCQVEYVLAEIDHQHLYLVAQDKLARANKPQRLIVFGRPSAEESA